VIGTPEGKQLSEERKKEFEKEEENGLGPRQANTGGSETGGSEG
jgi:hypothetical protein